MSGNFRIKDEIKVETRPKRRKDRMNDGIKLVGTWEVGLIDAGTGEKFDVEKGNFLTYEKGNNTIVNNGKERVAKLLNNVSSTYFRAIAIGTGTTGATSADTSLETEYTRATATLAYEADYKATFAKTFEFGSGVSENITEAGVFDSATVSGSTMLDRFTFSAKAVSATVDLYVKITITVS